MIWIVEVVVQMVHVCVTGEKMVGDGVCQLGGERGNEGRQIVGGNNYVDGRRDADGVCQDKDEEIAEDLSWEGRNGLRELG